MVRIVPEITEIKKDREDGLDYMWSLSSDEETNAVPQGEDTAFLNAFEQPSFPSPEYESEVSDAVLALDAYLSPRAEENMDFTLCDSPSRSNSPSISVGSDEGLGLALGFDELLDGNYGLSAVDDAADADLVDFLTGKSDENEGTPQKEIVKRETLDLESTDTIREVSEEEPIIQARSTVQSIAEAKENTEKSQVIILKKKDGSSKVLNVMPISKQSTRPLQTIDIVSASKTECRPVSPVRRSARVVKCTRQFRPIPSPVTNTITSAVSTVKPTPKVSMYPDVSVAHSTVEDKSRKNAVQAKMNREKKKAYITHLEGQVTDLSKENKKLAARSLRFEKETDSLVEEVEYLRNVLANQSALSRLLGNIPDVENISLTTSFRNDRKRLASDDHDYFSAPKARRSETSGGVCLHVANDNVSVEFCATCSRMAKENLFEE